MMSDQKLETTVTQQTKKKRHTVRNILIIVGAVFGLAIAGVIADVVSMANFDKHFETALSFYENNDYDNALPELDKAAKTIMAFADVFLIRGDIYLKKGSYYQAIDDYSKALQTTTEPTNKRPSITSKQKDEQAYAKRGWAYVQAGEYDLALSDTTKALELNPDNATAAAVLEFLMKRNSYNLWETQE
jgi:tetratricopeptide (TPR) repeat protein